MILSLILSDILSNCCFEKSLCFILGPLSVLCLFASFSQSFQKSLIKIRFGTFSRNYCNCMEDAFIKAFFLSFGIPKVYIALLVAVDLLYHLSTCIACLWAILYQNECVAIVFVICREIER